LVVKKISPEHYNEVKKVMSSGSIQYYNFVLYCQGASQYRHDWGVLLLRYECENIICLTFARRNCDGLWDKVSSPEDKSWTPFPPPHVQYLGQKYLDSCTFNSLIFLINRIKSWSAALREKCVKKTPYWYRGVMILCRAGLFGSTSVTCPCKYTHWAVDYSVRIVDPHWGDGTIPLLALALTTTYVNAAPKQAIL
jgi:hypothetical protein